MVKIKNTQGEWITVMKLKNLPCNASDVCVQDQHVSSDHILQELQSLEILSPSQEQSTSLSTPITKFELESALFQINPHKALGNDGLPVLFYQQILAYSQERYMQNAHLLPFLLC